MTHCADGDELGSEDSNEGQSLQEGLWAVLKRALGRAVRPM